MVSNEHCSITVYHQGLDDILKKSDNGYIVLNPEVIPQIIQTKTEEQQIEVESESSDEDLAIEESDDDCILVESSSGHKREGQLLLNDMDTKIQRIDCIVCWITFSSVS